MNLNVFPVELHSYICKLACADDGYTARSLGCVSKYFREVVHPFQYQSIAVSGQHQIFELESRLQRTQPRLRRVRNLYISESSDGSGDQASLKRGVSHTTRLLGLVSSTVEIIAIHCNNPRVSTSLLAFLFGLHYPRLRELTIVGYYPFPPAVNTMPRLNYLHLSGNRNPHGLLQMGGLDITCPELTHLRISGLSRATSFVAELAEAITGDEESRQSFNANLPKSVRHVIVQPGPLASVPVKGTSSRLSDDCMMDQLASLAGNSGIRGNVRFTLLERSECDNISATMRQQWIQRLAGGEGNWQITA
jgi:hypothetical protein